MTSLELFPPVEHAPKVPTEWGSGKLKEDVNIWIPGPPTWQYKGEPIDQYYTLTKLKLSNVRSNDELIQRPQATKMGEILINKDFPAEHPYSSHMSRYAVFPKFDASEDPKRGVQARREQPINAEMPSTAYDVQIVHKTKGFGDRREIQSLPKESEKKALEWQGEKGFHQLVKVHNGRQQFYPIPPKTVCPNLQERPADARISDRTANAMRNVERNQWKTTYDIENTGIGPANPMKLDNLADKQRVYDTYGVTDDNLYPRSTNTFDPPRPFEGRIARRIIPRPPPQVTEEEEENTDYVRMKTLREKEEYRLWNGTDYTNLPDTSDPENRFSKLRWKEMNDDFHPDPNLEKVGAVQERQPADHIPYPPVVNKPPGTSSNYLESTKQRQNEMFQQVEAQNRYSLLESEKPDHDITALNHKYKKVMEEEQPRTFYGHEGKYNEERAGLYKTSYSPERMAHSMNDRETSGPEIMNTLHSHVDALNLPTQLSYEVNNALKLNKALSSSTPNLAADKRDSREVLEPLTSLKSVQKSLLQPTVENARVKVQEGETILKDSEMGDSFNTKKFLQENDMHRLSRNEPLHLMSIENQNLNNVRGSPGSKPSSKNVSFSDNMTVASSREDGKFRIISAPTRGLTDEAADGSRQPNTIQYRSTHAEWKKENEAGGLGRRRPQPTFLLPDQKPILTERQIVVPENDGSPRRRCRRPATSFDETEYRDEFGSKSTNVAPSNLRHSYSFTTAYESQFPTYQHIGYKEDPRFLWEPGHGKPRPQTDLLKIQDSFSKSEVRKRFHSQFPEYNSDLRMNIISGKKHTFGGMNCQILHG